jgi:flagellin-like hook-associated protein FlgL
MGVTGIGTGTSLTLQSALDMRDKLNDLQRQLGTGKLSTSYAGLGLDRGLTIGLRSQLNSISGYQETITQVGVRLELMQTALSQVSSIAQQVKGLVLGSEFKLNGDTQTLGQKTSAGMLELLVASLDTNADGRYLFSGRTVDQVPVETTDHILNGDGLKAGLKQIIDERKQADLGASGLGRLVISGPGPTQTALTEDASRHSASNSLEQSRRCLAWLYRSGRRAPALTVDPAGPTKPRRDGPLHLSAAGRYEPRPDADGADVSDAEAR